MKKYLAYLAIVSVIFMGAAVYAQEDIETTSEKGDQNKEFKYEGQKGLRERALEMRTKIEDKIKERSERIKDDESEAKNVDTMCAQASVEARDTAIIAAFDAYSTSIKTALEARKVALKDAWSKPTASERSIARKTANKTYNTASKNAHKTLNTARKTAWDTHKTEMKKCGASAGIDGIGKIEGGLSL